MVVLALLILAIIVGLFLFSLVVAALFKIALFLLIVYLAGALAQSWLKYPGGFVTAFVSGLVGGVLGWIIAHALHAPTWPTIAGLPIIWTIVGAVIFVAVAKLVTAGRRGKVRPVR
jgi:uncharacterized membrane protein YeaQ/YmgE (transglycosylase-associated protein family)